MEADHLPAARRQLVGCPHHGIIRNSHKRCRDIFFPMCIDPFSPICHHANQGADCISQHSLINGVHTGKINDRRNHHDIFIAHNRVKIPVSAGDRGTDNLRKSDRKQAQRRRTHDRILQSAHSHHAVNLFLLDEF